MGIPHAFVRLAGCNLRCSWCDTKHAWGPGQPMTGPEVAAECGARHVCITGGEPLAQDLGCLFLALRAPRKLTVETNGTIPPPDTNGRVLWSVSPKFGSSGHHIDEKVLRQFRDRERVQFKLVFANEDDWNEAVDILRLIGPKVPVFLQPEGSRAVELSRWAWDRVNALPAFDVRLLPQVHTLIWGDERCR